MQGRQWLPSPLLLCVCSFLWEVKKDRVYFCHFPPPFLSQTWKSLDSYVLFIGGKKQSSTTLFFPIVFLTLSKRCAIILVAVPLVHCTSSNCLPILSSSLPPLAAGFLLSPNTHDMYLHSICARIEKRNKTSGQNSTCIKTRGWLLEMLLWGMIGFTSSCPQSSDRDRYTRIKHLKKSFIEPFSSYVGKKFILNAYIFSK